MGQGRGWEGAVLKLLRAKDFVLTVTEAEDVTADYRRLRLSDGGLLAATGVHPTMWVRLWFSADGRPHQRAYTLVDPDPAAGTFALEFALHEGVASDWARAARPGDTIEATVQGTGFQRPDPAPSHLVAIGDPASLPAVNSLLGVLGSAPATLWFEGGLDGLPSHADPGRHEIREVPRRDAGAHLVERVRAELPAVLTATPDPYVWIACDTTTTRTLASYVRRELGVPKQRLHALGYWRAD
ncbi:NADPH-dependent ferric siderophore reductase, contains FAD-binding and SIP domains [Streptomyces sp. 1222.5]|uniref:siderophore-interacting protein n=1 Tax=unclassified Streptomyces TaxID=2593676 RepID=UPI000897FBF4|nr:MULTISPECIES: siderophore-interacting protein [unclassified Streptomyces]PKW08687.1 NADPH-dependent ferric siderophore reductase [Streptomyces sp. 5112.2]SEC56369.1 NADPH-dependent ferric siderophore reductase, contains FAD-binding and SIP domains [Streptomyces sp. 1222.5]SED31593.1 NADPH-dependent ferric siderophore reductase, contains FAD-binding and SIP domains [Streptomyces sp. 2231.1]